MSAKATVGNCENCGKQELISPLHGERGGPSFCIRCGMDWYGKHGRRRNAGRIVIKAIKAYFAAGGGYSDIKKLTLAAIPYGFAALNTKIIQLGYETDTIGTELPDLTTELLRDVLQLVHPDHQPPERRELATRVTRELNALKPFVFPAPKPEPPPVYNAEPRDTSFAARRETIKEPSQNYPCEDCIDHVPFYYCDVCKAEWNRRKEAETGRERAKYRKWYARRKLRRELCTPLRTCICEKPFKFKRADARYCSRACKQKAYRQRQAASDVDVARATA